MTSNNYPRTRKDDIVVQDVNGEVLIYDLEKNKAFCLNETSALVWHMCDGTKSIAEISEILGNNLNVSSNEELVWLAIDQLKKGKLIENPNELVSPFQGMSRRDVIKKVGLTSLAVIPIVMALNAPAAAAAASVCGTTCTCDDMGAYTKDTACGTNAMFGGVDCPMAPAACKTCLADANVAMGSTVSGHCST